MTFYDLNRPTATETPAKALGAGEVAPDFFTPKTAFGVPSSSPADSDDADLRQLVEEGVLVQTGRGLYSLAEKPVSEHQAVIEASQHVPHGVVCLASALRFHDLTTQNPWKVWMLIETGKRVPSLDYPPVVVFTAFGASFSEGIEYPVLEGVPVPMTSVAKTVADCFKYRREIGLDVALEALWECLRGRRVTREELHHFARVCRVEKVMQPYIEAFSLAL